MWNYRIFDIVACETCVISQGALHGFTLNREITQLTVPQKHMGREKIQLICIE